MNVKENKNFKSVSLYTLPLNVEELKKAGKTFHMNNRNKRLDKVLEIEREIVINRTFIVDKGHKDGQELHIVTENGIIFIYNFMKLFLHSQNALITILIARPNQIKRLYEACNLTVNQNIIDKSIEHIKMGLNH